MSNLEIAVELCTRLYKELAPQNIFPALTGGTLYKDGERKDIDIVIYSSDEVDLSDSSFVHLLTYLGLTEITCFGRVTKCMYRNTSIDIIIPEFKGVYPCPK